MERVAAAAASASRQPEELTVITVAKTFPFSDVLLLNELGVLDIGENRAQELAAKVERRGEPAGRHHRSDPLAFHRAAAKQQGRIDRPGMRGAAHARSAVSRRAARSGPPNARAASSTSSFS